MFDINQELNLKKSDIKAQIISIYPPSQGIKGYSYDILIDGELENTSDGVKVLSGIRTRIEEGLLDYLFQITPKNTYPVILNNNNEEIPIISEKQEELKNKIIEQQDNQEVKID